MCVWSCEPRRLVLLGAAGIAVALAGCAGPKPPAKYPEGALLVRYEQATTHSSCLVASVAMAANYLRDKRDFSESGIREDLQRSGRDETSIADLKSYLADRGLHLVTLSGRLDDKPPTGLKYWLNKRGYPVICVINRDPEDAAFNHAVVVIGIPPNQEGQPTDIIHYLDPSSVEPLHSTEAAVFERIWARCEHAMMIVAAPPAEPTEDLK